MKCLFTIATTCHKHQAHTHTWWCNFQLTYETQHAYLPFFREHAYLPGLCSVFKDGFRHVTSAAQMRQTPSIRTITLVNQIKAELASYALSLLNSHNQKLPGQQRLPRPCHNIWSYPNLIYQPCKGFAKVGRCIMHADGIN
jgi:hypothetical protein